MQTFNLQCSVNDFGTLTLGQHRPGRTAVLRLESAMREMPQADMPVSHYFAAGVYVRELPIPKGVALVGKLHKQSHVTLLTKGDVSILTESGMERLQAPCTFVSPIGTKRAIYAHEDSVLVTAHGSYEVDMERLEQQLIAAEYDELPDMLRLAQ